MRLDIYLDDTSYLNVTTDRRDLVVLFSTGMKTSRMLLCARKLVHPAMQTPTAFLHRIAIDTTEGISWSVEDRVWWCELPSILRMSPRLQSVLLMDVDAGKNGLLQFLAERWTNDCEEDWVCSLPTSSTDKLKIVACRTYATRRSIYLYGKTDSSSLGLLLGR